MLARLVCRLGRPQGAFASLNPARQFGGSSSSSAAAGSSSGDTSTSGGDEPLAGVAAFYTQFSATRRFVREREEWEDRHGDAMGRKPPIGENKRGWRVALNSASRPKDANKMSRELNHQLNASGYRKQMRENVRYVKPTRRKFLYRKNKPYFAMKREMNAIFRTLEKRPQARARMDRSAAAGVFEPVRWTGKHPARHKRQLK